MQQSYVTVDGGETWERCGPVRKYNTHIPTDRSFFLNSELGWTITNRTVDRQSVDGVARSNDVGCTWQQLWTSRDNPDETYSDIYFLNEEEGWLAGNYIGCLRNTTNGGRTWNYLRLPVKGMRISDVYFETSRKGWIINSNPLSTQSGIYRTSDGGATWKQLEVSEMLSGLEPGSEPKIPPKWKAGRLSQMLFRARSK
jgi:photosystem II stability/assembly factor-like uncharacterized protein